MTKPSTTFWCDGCCDHIGALYRHTHRFICQPETLRLQARVEEALTAWGLDGHETGHDSGHDSRGANGTDRPDGPGVG